jgi:uncharacterized protein (TIGR00266 family)
MQISVESKPSYGMAVVTLDKGEEFVTESGAMVAMSQDLEVDVGFNGTGDGGCVGFLVAAFVGIVRKFLAGETMFVNTYEADKDGQMLMVAPGMVGDVVHLEMPKGRIITLQSSAYLAATPDVEVSLVWGGFKMLFGGEGAFFMECGVDEDDEDSNGGQLLFNSYGAIEEIPIDGKYVVDTGHLVGWEGDLEYSIRKAGGWKATMLSGEGLVLEFEGKGTLWLQTRNMGSLVSWITPELP